MSTYPGLPRFEGQLFEQGPLLARPLEGVATPRRGTQGPPRNVEVAVIIPLTSKPENSEEHPREVCLHHATIQGKADSQFVNAALSGFWQYVSEIQSEIIYDDTRKYVERASPDMLPRVEPLTTVELTKRLSRTRSRSELTSLLRSLGNSTDPATDQQLFQILKENSTPAISRWALLEFLTARGYPGLLSVVTGHLGEGACDEFLNGCTIALRILRIPEDERGRIAELMRSQAQRLWPWNAGTDEMQRIAFRDTLLVLGSHGDESDVALFLEVLECDRPKLEFMTHTLEGLRRLLVRKASMIEQANSMRIRDILGQFLDAWCKPLVLVEQSILHRTASVLRVLCARLAEPDLQCVVCAVRRSERPSLGVLALDYIREAQDDLRSVALQDWVDQQADGVTTAVGSLRELARP